MPHSHDVDHSSSNQIANDIITAGNISPDGAEWLSRILGPVPDADPTLLQHELPASLSEGSDATMANDPNNSRLLPSAVDIDRHLFNQTLEPRSIEEMKSNICIPRPWEQQRPQHHRQQTRHDGSTIGGGEDSATTAATTSDMIARRQQQLLRQQFQRDNSGRRSSSLP